MYFITLKYKKNYLNFKTEQIQFKFVIRFYLIVYYTFAISTTIEEFKNVRTNSKYSSKTQACL